MTQPIQLVWFKRDLRVEDHEPLVRACAAGPVLPLFIIEPEQLQAADFDPRHWVFTGDCLLAVRESLAGLGQPLIVRIGEAVSVLEALSDEYQIDRIWAHEETFNWISYQRDRRVRGWARSTGIQFTELPKDGVIRRLASRDDWSGLWEARMSDPPVPAPSAIRPVLGIEPGDIPTLAELGLAPDRRTEGQPGGSAHALALLDSFLRERGEGYTMLMSSPVTAEETCSRLSPHLALGTISMRTVVYELRKRVAELRAMPPPERGSWLKAMSSFNSRLHWRDHFIQKLEDEPEIEFRSFAAAYDGIRTQPTQPDWLDSWATGNTGYPLIDACMRALDATGWINFRMRALLVSFACFDLWLDWRPVGTRLARLFVDYEPGIHWSQLQMQAGTTGINTLRIYNPTKQAIEQDPDGAFIRRWVPELREVPTPWIHQPWTLPGSGFPMPIVDHTSAANEAKAIMYAIRKQPETRAQAYAVQLKHGSRSSPFQHNGIANRRRAVN